MKRSFIALALAIGLTLAAVAVEAKKVQTVRAPGGTNNQLGLVIEASYDPRLDNVVPGYKIIDVALINQSFNVLMMDPERDRWQIRLDGADSHPITAIHDLRSQMPKAWNALPEKVKGMLGYPLALPIGGREVIDIFVPVSVDLERFTEVDIYFKSIDQKVEILSRQ